ncbi:MAG TPA: DNA polymerase III subunit beta [Ktedonobacterales bacterium]|nr:DNA polymerase III subunit beta [Ktedonobacterales bacterium]
MKITCKQQDLAHGLSMVSHAVATRSTLPILANILIATDTERIRLSATNLEIGVSCWVPATIHTEGTTTVPARLLTDFVNTLPPGSVDLSLQPGGGQTLKISGHRTSANVRGMDPAEFPAIPSVEGSESPVYLDAAELRGMISQVTFAAATDDARPVFTGVLARIADDRLTFASADSFRLAVRTAPLPAASGGGVATAVGDVLIPARTLSELGRVLPDEGTVQMFVTPNRNQVVFHTETVELVSNLIAGQFPNYQSIVPKTHATRAVMKTDDLRAAAKRASLFARDSANITRIKIEAGEGGGAMPGSVTLSATAEELGDATDTVDAAVDGQGLEIIFNVKYLSEVLAVLDTPEVALEVNNPQSPGVIKPVGKDEDHYTYVVMPMHNTR